jgi:hypothetical protein
MGCGKLVHGGGTIGPNSECIIYEENDVKGVIQHIGFRGGNYSNDLTLRIVIDGKQQYPDDIDIITLVKNYGGNPENLLGKGLFLVPLDYHPRFLNISAQLSLNLPFESSLKISIFNKNTNYPREAHAFVNIVVEKVKS